jgi:hypothetical protein
MDKREAAALLGMTHRPGQREIRSVDDNWIVTFDGSMHEVPTGPVDHWVRTNPKENPPKYHPVYAAVESDEGDDEADEVDEDVVPDGTAQQILDWVGDDKTRAAKALAVEEAKGVSARKSLVAALEKLAS